MLKMKKIFKFNHLVLITFLFIGNFCYSQIYEIGYISGKSNFIGDIGETTFINPINNKISNDWINGIHFKWNRSPRHSYRFSYISTDLAANDFNSSDPRRIERGLNFRTPLKEYSLGMDFTMFDFNLHEPYNIFTPYISSGIIYSKFNKQFLDGDEIITHNSSKNTFGIPIILGIKYRFLNHFIVSFELGARYTFTDDIDGNSFNDEFISYDFGNINNNDWYMFSVLNVSYTFGRNPCYCNIGK